MAKVVISDIHADDVALEAGLSKIDEIDSWLKQNGSAVSEVIVNGDVVGRGARPRETFQLLIEAEERRQFRYVPGNHEQNMASMELPPYSKMPEEKIRKAISGFLGKENTNSWIAHRKLLFPDYRGLFDRMISCEDCDLKDTNGELKPGIQYETDAGQRRVIIIHSDPTFEHKYLADADQLEVRRRAQSKGEYQDIESTVQQICDLAESNGGGSEIVLVHGHTHIPSFYKTVTNGKKITAIDGGSISWSRGSNIPPKQDMTGQGTFLVLLDDPTDPMIDGQKEMLAFFQYDLARTIAYIAEFNAQNEHKLKLPPGARK